MRGIVLYQIRFQMIDKYDVVIQKYLLLNSGNIN